MRIRWTTIFLDLPASGHEAGLTFWSTVTATTPSAPRGAHGEFVTLLPRHGDAYLRVQRLGSGPARCHLDLHLDATELIPQAERAEGLGAVRVHSEEGLEILSSPGGFSFCLVPWDGEDTVPPAPALPGSEGTARLDQLCLDVPPAAWERECAFWQALTGWEPVPTGSPEFTRLRRPEGQPVHLLLQRLDDPAPTVTAHPDFAAPERFSLAPAHAAAGATAGRSTADWTVMTAPAGLAYCLTGRTP
ncbi:hypothetical protein KIH74_23255 [Kineosporia sp. J2-2]|uniref:Glyoxalase-like domain-containing protein n=1 Tax=Kineosporia corallincola TaxID=2835133 RepID=A0ABS5TQH2_9ACTN|nr:VOC family protein [Kineosporia corallincola]MBT0771879.1 hypothetical protein [Kineosporia corallincola]